MHQQPISLIHDSVRLDVSFRADLIVENCVLFELKAIEEFGKVHFRQVQTYLKLSHLKLDVLVNFNVAYLKDGVRRIANKL